MASAGRVQKQSGSYTFRIEGYSGLSANVGISTESPEFRLCGHCWQLRIFPGGSLETHKNFVSYYLASKSTKQARASYKLSVKCQISEGSDETFSSSGVRLFEAKGTPGLMKALQEVGEVKSEEPSAAMMDFEQLWSQYQRERGQDSMQY